MTICKKCVLPGTFPGIQFDEHGVCNFCNEYLEKKNQAERDFANEEELKQALEKYKTLGHKYDVLVPISGGVDSCFTLIRIVETFGLKPLVFHNDHGFDDPTAAANVEKLCRKLDVDLLIWKNDRPYMRKLFKYFNESEQCEVSPCYACGNMLYLNGLEIAGHFDIPLVVNGYSKGQAAMMHDSEKARRWYSIMINVVLETGDKEFFKQFTQKWTLLDKQIIYQSRHDLEKPVHSGKILFIPLFVFEFYNTDKEILKKICRERFDWQPVPMSYPARTTNCEMIWLNSYMDLKKRGYTHYHDEYSTIIRAGEMSREQAVKDLEFNPPPGLLERLANEINFHY
ncbi:MAG: hypothetical protein MUF15_12830 [Acidobacteria bacterium]|jgi:hypothetical protein|nr:hypothetical protein [Acidobacteriota bacterium]